MSKHLVIFSICKDEAATIGELLDRMPKKISGIDTITRLVISDGSTDETAAIAAKHGAEVIDGHSQKRLAYRFSQAIEWALQQNADYAVNIDGDLQFAPEDIPKLLAPVVSGEAEFCAADRFTDPKTGERRRPANMPAAKYYGNLIGVKLVSVLSKTQFRDVTCGFRAYSRKAMFALNINSTYTYTQESFQVLASKHIDIATLPVTVTYYPGRKSRVVTSILGFVATSALNIVRFWRDFAPLRFFGALASVPFVLGVLSLLFTVGHWLINGSFSPYKFVGLAGLYLFSLGLLLWIIGLLADMNSRVLNNQEKILENLKRIRYDQGERED